MPDRAPPDVWLGHLADLQGGHDACRDLTFLEGVLERERIDDRAEHTHVVALRAVHAGARALQAAEDVSAADHDTDLGPFRVHLRELPGEG